MLANKIPNYNPQSGLERFNFILSKLTVTTVNGGVAKCHCPVHDDGSPSLQVKLKSNEHINVKCFAENCDYEAILKHCGVTPAFLYPPQKQKFKRSGATTHSGPRIVAEYPYKRANGRIEYYAVRFEPKDFRLTKNPRGKDWSMKGITRVPYNLPEVARNIKKDKLIIFVEGEKDADNGNKLGFTCTTVAGGCGKWRPEYAQYFKNADIVCIPDNDKPGIKGMLRIAKKLSKVAKRVRVLKLPVKYKGDLSDWIKASGDSGQLWSLIGLESVFLDESLVVERLNDRHAAIMVQGKFVVINEDYNPIFKRQEITLSSKNNFLDRYYNKPVNVTRLKKDKKTEIYEEKKVRTSKGYRWLNSPQRRQYDGFCFDSNNDDPQIGELYNLWRGFAVKPKEGNCSLFHRHIFEVITQENTGIYNYILDWMADAVQNRTKRPGVSMVFRGASGAGKNAAIELFGGLFGQHFLAVSDSKHVVGNFNAHLKDCLILFADEAFYAGDKKHESILKTLLTSPTIMVEYKGKDAIVMPNYIRLMMSSNKDWVAPLEMDDRRWFILDVSDRKVKNYEYFDALFEQMDNQGGSAALLYELLRRDISKTNIKDYPATKAILDNKLDSLDPTAQWIYHMLLDGDLVEESKTSNISQLYKSYMDFCGKHMWPDRPNGFQRAMRKFFPKIRTHRKYQETGRYYVLPDLKECRRQFEDKLHAKIEWGDDEGEQEDFEHFN